MQIDVISDSIFPWCYIGKRRLEKALEQARNTRPDLDFEVVWRPYQLNPETPKEGYDRKTYLEAKFGDKEQAKGVYKVVLAAAEEEGLDFTLDKQKRLPNTIDSHRLAHWAQTAGVQNEVIEGLFQKYFIEGEDISDPKVLVQVAEDAGMDGDIVARLLGGDADLEKVKEEEAIARRMGVTGVPCFIIDQKVALVGAQDPDMLLRAIDHVLEQAAAE